MSKTYKEGYWIFVYWPKRDFLMMAFKGLRKGFWPYGTGIWEAATDSFSLEGVKDMREQDWDSYFIDTVLTKDWREAYTIASKHFNTMDVFAEMRLSQRSASKPRNQKKVTK